MGKQYKHLTLEKRYKLEALHMANIPITQIAKQLGVHRSTIYRELNRATYMHRKTDWTEECRYAPEKAEELYRKNLKNKGKDLKIGKDLKYAMFLESKIVDENYSPVAALYSAKKEKFETSICATTLYSYIDKKLFMRLSNDNLPVKKSKKREYNHIKRHKRAAAGTSIEERQKDVLTRAEFGHWEMDTVVGKQKVAKKSFLVLTERKTRDEILFLLKTHTMKEVVKALNFIEKEIGTNSFRKIFKSITVDNGTEFSDFRGMERTRRSAQKRTKIYYCHPYSSSERGSNENNNKLVRRHYPKGTVFDKLTSSEVRELQDWMNNYPRRMFDGKSSAEMFLSELKKIDLDARFFARVEGFFLPRASPYRIGRN